MNVQTKFKKIDDINKEDYIVYNQILSEISKILNEEFTCANPDDSINNARHKIAHGYATDKETEVNALKKFLYINKLYKAVFTIDNHFESHIN